MFAIAAVITAAICFAGCYQPIKSTGNEAEQWQQQRLQLYNDSIYPAIKQLVQPGDMITRLGTDITSEMLRQMNQHDASYSHCGIALLQNDTIFVYHAIGGEFNPNQKLKKETLYAFAHPVENKGIGLYRPALPQTKVEKLSRYISACYMAGLPFDMDFDYATNNRQYCAEFVAKCYTRSAADSSWLRFSQIGSKKYVAVDNLSGSSLMRKIAGYKF